MRVAAGSMVISILTERQVGRVDSSKMDRVIISENNMAQSCRLRPGDMALMRGTLQQQTVALENGETTIINHFYVTSIEVLSKSNRMSITAYEREKTQ
ncbi:MAG TPA: hypothetical protein VIX20_03790 [Ktedonobacteraceae bacterium]